MNSQTAIYSANFEESITVENWSPLHDSKSNIIWEGHGALTNILNDEHNNPQVTGKVNVSDSTYYDYFIEVLIQLHPVRTLSCNIRVYLTRYIYNRFVHHYRQQPLLIPTKVTIYRL